tara:strand:- start:77 stop:760 length:684 start_codon:yes stop_codon:yes gene_type:complete
MNNSPIFWNTQGNITYDTEKNYFNYETSMSVNWNNKLARRVLITIMKLFNRPEILGIKANGVAIWTYDNLKNNIFYKLPIIFNEIILRDEYVADENNVFNPQYPFLTVCYRCKLEDRYIKSLSQYHNYVSYDSNKFMLNIKSRTLEENLVILHIFFNDNNLNKKNIPIVINKKMNKLNKKSQMNFVNELKNYIEEINGIIGAVILPSIDKNDMLEENIIDEEQNKLE